MNSCSLAFIFFYFFCSLPSRSFASFCLLYSHSCYYSNRSTPTLPVVPPPPSPLFFNIFPSIAILLSITRLFVFQVFIPNSILLVGFYWKSMNSFNTHLYIVFTSVLILNLFPTSLFIILYLSLLIGIYIFFRIDNFFFIISFFRGIVIKIDVYFSFK